MEARSCAFAFTVPIPGRAVSAISAHYFVRSAEYAIFMKEMS